MRRGRIPTRAAHDLEAEHLTMLISDALAKTICQQIGLEYYAAIQYAMIASYVEREALPELTALFRSQAAEELTHGQKFIDYVSEAGGIVEIPAIDKGRADFASLEDAVQTALDNELKVTATINSLMDQAIEENDHLARGFLQWFVDEQLEEVSLQSDLLTVVKRATKDLNYVEQYVSRLPKSVGASATGA
jgi:ferritin